VRVGFGLDLGGFSKGGSSLAAIEADGSEAEVFILSESPFAEKIAGEAELAPRIEKESTALRELLDRGPLAVDVPIDLQNLWGPQESTRVWELTLRPIDKAFSALPSLASWLGACVARFRAANNVAGSSLDAKYPLFETYLAASLEIVELPFKGYKKKSEESSGVRQEIQKGLGIEGRTLPHDDLDAVICALATIADGDDILEGEALQEVMLGRLKNEAVLDRHTVPRDYRLLKKRRLFERVGVQHCSYNIWLQQHPK
jgi:hypothetical protein